QQQAHQCRQAVRTRWQFGGVVLGDQAAHRDACVGVEQGHDRIEDLATDVLEIDIDAVRTGVGQVVGQTVEAVVEADVEAQLIYRVGTLVRSAGDADHPTALELGHLTHHAAHRSRGRCHHHRLAGL